ncbi:dynactin subunit 3 isoform X2 [Astyanax mexicanus]|uniref:Dynactin subunit 3 isoform X2 n=1 Tax=Astyanax mexicanus TaxID=7994 RepID=A0A8T2LVN2_ASTMX|nr:dynactin subunit 3 isoform X2 [Astyanax mexicanus]
MEGGGLQDLDARLQALEKRVYSERGRNSRPVKCAESLARINTALANTANKRERVKILHKKIEDLLKYLDPQFTAHIAVPDAMKLEFILAEEDFLCSQAALLEQVNNLQPLLDSNHIKGKMMGFSNFRCSRPAGVHICRLEELSAEVRRLIEEYNKMMFLLSKQFTQWDETLRKLEATKQGQPIE